MNGRGVAAAILSGLCMGTMGVFSRKTGFDAALITFFRLFLGAMLMLVFLLLTTASHSLKRWPTWPVMINGLMLSGFILFYVQAMNYTTMANAIMMLYLAPLLAAVYAHIFLSERLNLTGGLLIGSALFGFTMMMEFSFDLSSGSNNSLGLLYAALGLLCYTGFILINRIIHPSVPVFTRTFYQLLTGALCVLPFCADKFGAVTLTSLPWILGVGLIPGFLGILLAVYALDKLPAATFGTLAYLEPIFVVLLGWVLFAETLSSLQLTGCALILLSGLMMALIATKGTGKIKLRN